MAASGIDQEKSSAYDVQKRTGSSDDSHGHADAHDAAAHGHVATDRCVTSLGGTAVTTDILNSHGNAILQFDKAAERRLRNKIDFYTVPTVTIIYLMHVAPC